ncbi:hypothetical protein ACFLUZ_05820 [Chloroflexota bacterium]
MIKRKVATTVAVKSERRNPASHLRPEELSRQASRPSAQPLAANDPIEDELTKLRAARIEVQRIRLSAQRELVLAQQMRVKADNYRQETETKARSQAHTLILQARLATKKEIAELKREVGDTVQRILADIRMLRITAQEELGAQRKFTDAARIRALSLAIQEEAGEKSESEEEAVGV